MEMGVGVINGIMGFDSNRCRRGGYPREAVMSSRVLNGKRKKGIEGCANACLSWFTIRYEGSDSFQRDECTEMNFVKGPHVVTPTSPQLQVDVVTLQKIRFSFFDMSKYDKRNGVRVI